MDGQGKLPDLVFLYPDSFPEEIIEDELSAIKSTNLDFHVIKRDVGPYNGFEWIIPTAFCAYILKPYFDAFLSQAGKDHYDILKSSLKKLLEKGKQFETKAVASDKSPDKLSKSYTQSLTVSVEFQTIDNRHIKLLFDGNLTFEDWCSSIDRFLEIMLENYKSYPNDNLTKKIEELKTKPTRIVYVIMNLDTREFELFDDKKLLEKYH